MVEAAQHIVNDCMVRAFYANSRRRQPHCAQQGAGSFEREEQESQ